MPVGELHQALARVAQHGYLLLFAWVAAEQLGLPIPAVPILVAAGVLSAMGQLSFLNALALAVLACLIGDAAWYGIGKWRGRAVLATLCRITLEPESCVRRSSDFIARYGGRSLVFAKFVPGISTVAVPLAADSGVSVPAFLFYDILGSVLYTGAFLAVGHLMGDRLDRLTYLAQSMKSVMAALAVAGALGIVAWRYHQRRSFLKELRVARIAPEEVLRMIQSEEPPFIVDLRHPLDVLPDPRVIPGAVRMTPDELAGRHDEIPRDRQIILYCT